MNITLFGKRIFPDVITLRTLRYHLGLIIQGGLKFSDECPYKREKTDIKRRTCEKRQSYADTSQGMPGANRT